jgi:hypothetical protein
MKIQEGRVIEVEGQRFLVEYVEYAGNHSRLWIKELKLRGIRDGD